MAVDAHISGDIGQVQRTVGIGVAVMAVGNQRFFAVRMAMTVRALRNCVCVWHLTGGICMINFVAKGAGLLMTLALAFPAFEDRDMTLGALLDGQRLNLLVK